MKLWLTTVVLAMAAVVGNAQPGPEQLYQLKSLTGNFSPIVAGVVCSPQNNALTFYTQNTNKHLWQCSAVSGTYTWWDLAAASGGGTVGGTGTTGKLSKWIGGNTLGDSAFDETTRADGETLTNKAMNVLVTSTDPGETLNQVWYSELQLSPSGLWNGQGEKKTFWVEEQLDFDNALGTIDKANLYLETDSNGDTKAINSIAGAYSEVAINGAAPINIIYGIESFAGNYGGAVANIQGSDLEGWNQFGTVGNGNGASGTYSQAGTGTTNSARAVEGMLHVEATGHMNFGSVIKANTPQVLGSGTIGQIIGVEIQEQAHAGVTTAYQLYSAGVAATYFHSANFQLDNIGGHGTAGVVHSSNTGVLSQSLVDLGTDTTGSLPAAAIPAQYKKWVCEPGQGDGFNAIAAGTYPQFTCYNNSGVTWTITNIKCLTDNNGTSTLSVTNGAGTALLTGAITCTNSWASGTQSGTVTIASGDYASFSFVSDGTSKQTTWLLGGTF